MASLRRKDIPQILHKNFELFLASQMGPGHSKISLHYPFNDKKKKAGTFYNMETM